MNSIICNFDNRYSQKYKIEYYFDYEKKTWSLIVNDSLEMDSSTSSQYEKAFENLLLFINQSPSDMFFKNILIFGGGDFQLVIKLILHSSPDNIESFNFGALTIVDPLVDVLPKVTSFNDPLLEYLIRYTPFLDILDKYSITYSDFKNRCNKFKIDEKFDLIISDISDSSSSDDISNEIYNTEYISFMHSKLSDNGFLISYCGAYDSEFKLKESYFLNSGFEILKIENAGFGNMILAKKRG